MFNYSSYLPTLSLQKGPCQDSSHSITEVSCLLILFCLIPEAAPFFGNPGRLSAKSCLSLLQRLSCATPPKYIGWSQGITRIHSRMAWGRGEEREHALLWFVPLEELKKVIQVQEISWSKDFYAETPQLGLLHFLALLVSVSAPQAAPGGILLFRDTFGWCRGSKKNGRGKLQRFGKFPF